ncbi:MAG: MFS transporter [Ktedonobacteraceae bacterium]
MSKTEEEQHTTRTPALRIQVAIAFFAFILIGANDGATGVLIPSLRAQYGVDKATIGLLFLSAVLGYLIAAFNSGPLVGKLGIRLFLLLGVGSFLTSAIVLSTIPPFWVALLMLLPLGFGGALLDAGLNAYIAALPRNTALLNYLHAFYGIGALLGPILASTIFAVGLTWNFVYITWIFMSVVLFVSVMIFFKRRTVTAQEGRTSTEKNTLVSTLKRRIVWIVALFLLFYVGTEVSLGNWSYSFLLEERHGLPLISGWIVSGYWIGLTLGRLVLPRVALRYGDKRLIQGCLVGVGIGVLIVWLIPINAVAAFGLCLTGFCLGPIFPTTIGLMSQLVPSRLLASAIGFLASLGSMGAALFPWLAGNLAQAVGLWSLMPYVITLTVAMMVFWLTLQRQPPSYTL